MVVSRPTHRPAYQAAAVVASRRPIRIPALPATGWSRAPAVRLKTQAASPIRLPFIVSPRAAVVDMCMEYLGELFYRRHRGPGVRVGRVGQATSLPTRDEPRQ